MLFFWDLQLFWSAGVEEILVFLDETAKKRGMLKDFLFDFLEEDVDILFVDDDDSEMFFRVGPRVGHAVDEVEGTEDVECLIKGVEDGPVVDLLDVADVLVLLWLGLDALLEFQPHFLLEGQMLVLDHELE